MVIVGVRVLNVPVVPMCLLVIIEAVIAVMLHHAELWAVSYTHLDVYKRQDQDTQPSKKQSTKRNWQTG